MRCPKCHYIAFDSGERCRNCGYEFSLAVDASETPASPELPIRMAEPMGPLADLALRPESPSRTGSKRRTTARRASASRSRRTEGEADDLPLFLETGPVADAPLVRSSGTPRPPLAVRRATPARPRQAEPRPPAPPLPELADLAFDPEFTEPEEFFEPDEAGPVEPDVEPRTDDHVRSTDDLRPRATPADRLVAGMIDLALIGAIDAGVLYFTLRILALQMADSLTLPMIPLLGFLALLNGGYLAAFTAAGGQTIGKMARGIKVIGDGGRVTVGQAITRTFGYILSALPVGLGFVAAALGPDGVALHDRIAGTRVVRCVDS